MTSLALFDFGSFLVRKYMTVERTSGGGEKASGETLNTDSTEKSPSDTYREPSVVVRSALSGKPRRNLVLYHEAHVLNNVCVLRHSQQQRRRNGIGQISDDAKFTIFSLHR